MNLKLCGKYTKKIVYLRLRIGNIIKKYGAMNNFVYDIPVKVYFGENQLSHLAGELARYLLLSLGEGRNGSFSIYGKIQILRLRVKNGILLLEE